MTKQYIVISGMTAAGAMLAGALIMPSEGLRLAAYRDPIGIVSDCWGHTKTARLGQTNTEAECIRKLQSDMQEHWDGVMKCAPGLAKAPPRVQGATLSFAYNVGVAKACQSTFVHKAQSGDYPGACAELPRWVFMGGKDCRKPESRCDGLVTRRSRERAVCDGKPISMGVQG